MACNSLPRAPPPGLVEALERDDPALLIFEKS